MILSNKMFLVATPKIKTKYCVHNFELRFEQGTNKSYQVCSRCKLKRRVVVTDENKIRYVLPTSKRSNFKSFLEHFQEMQESPNWSTISHDGLHLPGTEEPRDWCASWYTKGCLNVENHEHVIHAKGKIFIKRRQRFCYRASCERCKLKWMYRESNNAAKRLEKYEKESNKKAKHIAVIPPWYEQSKSVKELRKKVYSILKELKTDGGAVIAHPFKTEKTSKMLYPAMHFHVVGFGWLEGTKELYSKNGWRVVNLGPRDSTFATVLYQLSHAGIKKGNKAITWFGNLSYRHFKIEKEPEIDDTCPVCNSKLKEIEHYGLDTPPPPDVRMEMFVDPRGWYIVKTRQKSELSKKERSEYMLNKLLYDANKGMYIGLT